MEMMNKQNHIKLTNLKTYGEVRKADGFILDVVENYKTRVYELDRVAQKQFFIDRGQHWLGLTNCVYKYIFVDALAGTLIGAALTYHKAVDRVKCFEGVNYQIYIEQVNQKQLRIYTTGKYYFTRSIDLRGYAYDIEGQIMDTLMCIFKIDNKEIHNDLYYKNID